MYGTKFREYACWKVSKLITTDFRGHSQTTMPNSQKKKGDWIIPESHPEDLETVDGEI